MGKLYDYRGRPIASDRDDFNDNYTLTYHFDSTSASWYSLIRINQTKLDGSKQYPFVRYLGSNNMKSPRLLRQAEPWDLIINCGWSGLEIENSVVKEDGAASNVGICALTINSSGELGYIIDWESGSGENFVNNGIVSASTSFFPLIVNYAPYTTIPSNSEIDSYNWQHAQRQIIGQWANGDYAIITSEGRGYAHSTGITPARCIEICQSLGLKFAFNLDGGGSTQTVIGDKTLNTIYEGTDGRRVPTFIVFNGTDEFFIPT